MSHNVQQEVAFARYYWLQKGEKFHQTCTFFIVLKKYQQIA